MGLASPVDDRCFLEVPQAGERLPRRADPEPRVDSPSDPHGPGRFAGDS